MSEHRNVKAELVSIACQLGWYGGRAVSVLMVGPPGTGKTQFTKQLAEKFSQKLGYEIPFSAAVLPQTMPEEISGVNVPNLERTAVSRLPLVLIKRLCDSKQGHGLLLMDELSSASSATGAATMTVASDGRAGDIELNNKVSRVFCMNPPNQAANARELSPPEANRFVWVENWRIPAKDYFDYLEGGPGFMAHVKFVEPDFETKWGPLTRSWVSAFLERNGKRLNELDSGERSVESCQQGPWASERSWDLAARLLAAVISAEGGKLAPTQRARTALAAEALHGCIGQGAAQAFLGWLGEMDIPSPEEAFADPEGVKLPERNDKLRVFFDSIANAALNCPQSEFNDKWNKAWVIIGRSEKHDVQYNAAKLLGKTVPAGCTTPDLARNIAMMRTRAGMKHG